MCYPRPGRRCTDDACKDLAKAQAEYKGTLPVDPATAASSYDAYDYMPKTEDDFKESLSRMEYEQDILKGLKAVRDQRDGVAEPPAENTIEALDLRIGQEHAPSNPADLDAAIERQERRVRALERNIDGLPRRPFESDEEEMAYKGAGYPEGQHPYDYDSFHPQHWEKFYSEEKPDTAALAFQDEAKVDARMSALRSEIATLEDEHEAAMLRSLEEDEPYDPRPFVAARKAKEEELEELSGNLRAGAAARQELEADARARLSSPPDEGTAVLGGRPKVEADPINARDIRAAIAEEEEAYEYWQAETTMSDEESYGVGGRNVSPEDEEGYRRHMAARAAEDEERRGRISRLKREEERRAGHQRRAEVAAQRERELAAARAKAEQLNQPTPAIPDPAPRPTPEIFNQEYKKGESVAGYMQELDKAVGQLRNDEDWTRYLNNVSKFHSYSRPNQMLIQMQSPGAERVAGYNTWRDLGRQVKKGEKGIKILAPVSVDARDAQGNKVLDENGNPVKRTFFKPVTVFDVSQTEGEDYSYMPKSLSAEPPAGFKEDLEKAISAEGYRIEYESGRNVERHGATDPVAKVVRVRADMPPSGVVSTLAHEYGHIKAGHVNRVGEYHVGRGGSRGMMEVEAESIAYIVCRANGMQPQTNQAKSARYVWGWKKTASEEQLHAAANTVAKVSKEILGSGLFRNAPSHGGRVNPNAGL